MYKNMEKKISPQQPRNGVFLMGQPIAALNLDKYIRISNAIFK